MAKVFHDVIGDRDNVYNAATIWRENCLLHDSSLFNNENHIWKLENLQALKARFNDNPVYSGNLSFDKKFEMQLQGASQDIYELALEILYVYYLFPSSRTISYRTKQLKLKDIASWGKVPYDEHHPLIKDLEFGIGATGTYFLTAKFEEISYIIQFSIALKQLSIEDRRTLVMNPWELKKVIESTKNTIGKNVQVQHIISHLILPEYFESMASAGHKSLIVNSFKDHIKNKNEVDIDKQLFEIRQSLEEKSHNPVNFYHNQELYDIWKPRRDNNKKKPEIVKDMGSSYNTSDLTSNLTLGNLVFENEGILLTQIQNALKSGKHIILTGPPGTGKSKLANVICDQIGVSNKLVTATANWTTYDTIGGYKPDKNGELYFDPGLFLQCFKNKDGTNVNEWLIIDEINRADIDKAFGPLFSVLAGDEVTLPYEMKDKNQIVIKPEMKVNSDIQRNEFVVPNDWRIIGTMNTIDKSSLFEMSYAFMRRFAFIPVGVPKSISPRLVEAYLETWSIDNYTHLETLAILWEVINQYRKIGPAIVHDIATYTVESEDFTSAIILFVLPQFEGLNDYKIIDFVKQLGVKLGDVIATDLLRDFIEDFFNIGIIDEE